MSEELFASSLTKLNIKLDQNMLTSFKNYYQLLIEYNSHTNLTAITEQPLVYLKHFYDSSAMLAHCTLDLGRELLDIGSGAGFPGLVLAILRPDLKITLLDATAKKTLFLEQVVQKLMLANVTILNSRVEELHLKSNKKYDYITSRAVANIHILLEISCQVLKTNGQLICLKGNREEVSDVAKITKLLGYSSPSVTEYNLPIENSNRSVIVFDKEKPTPLKYPREYKQIKKSPL